MMQIELSTDLIYMQEKVREVNKANGWFDKERPVSADVALLHSEVSEAYEGYREGDLENFAEELGDVLIRLLDTAERHKIDLPHEVYLKLQRNAKRGYRHGGKLE